MPEQVAVNIDSLTLFSAGPQICSQLQCTFLVPISDEVVDLTFEIGTITTTVISLPLNNEMYSLKISKILVSYPDLVQNDVVKLQVEVATIMDSMPVAGFTIDTYSQLDSIFVLQGTEISLISVQFQLLRGSVAYFTSTISDLTTSFADFDIEIPYPAVLIIPLYVDNTIVSQADFDNLIASHNGVELTVEDRSFYSDTLVQDDTVQIFYNSIELTPLTADLGVQTV